MTAGLAMGCPPNLVVRSLRAQRLTMTERRYDLHIAPAQGGSSAQQSTARYFRCGPQGPASPPPPEGDPPSSTGGFGGKNGFAPAFAPELAASVGGCALPHGPVGCSVSAGSLSSPDPAGSGNASGPGS